MPTATTRKKVVDKSLADKAIEIDGRKYVQVKDRIVFFNEHYPAGKIFTEFLQREGKALFVRAIVTPDVEVPARCFVAHAMETVGDGKVNNFHPLENAETSAVGRALGMMGIGVIDAIASSDEVATASKKGALEQSTAGLIAEIQTIAQELGYGDKDVENVISQIKTHEDARRKINFLKKSIKSISS